MTPGFSVADVGAIVKEAGLLALDRLWGGQRVSPTGRRNVATTVDRAVHQFLRRRLRDLLPASHVLSEEGRLPKGNSRYVWIVDPIDGTSNLDYANTHFAVSVALVRDTNVILGVISDPQRAELFAAARGQGASLNGKRIAVRGTRTVNEAIVSVGVPYDRELLPAAAAAISRLVLACRDIRRTGSSALDLCYVACGRTDAHVEVALSPWDVAAASLVLRESGGKLTTWNGTFRPLLVPGSVLASNPGLNSGLATLLKEGTPAWRLKRPRTRPKPRGKGK